jgi:membrane-bound inhibitor of C-type lysozyme
MKKTLISLLIVLLAGAAVYFSVSMKNKINQPKPEEQAQNSTQNQTPITATYYCDGGKTITAKFYKGENVNVKPGEMPVPTGWVEVSLSGDPFMTLKQTISASGVRYANDDESFVFWNKGDEALIMRNNSMDLSYKNCNINKPTPVSVTPSSNTIVTTGVLKGAMSIGPVCPVEQIDNPCKATPEMYAAHPVYVYNASRSKLFATLIPDANGNFSATLHVGTYVVDVAHQAIGVVTGVPATVQISSGKTSTIAINIDTGIR